MLGLKKFLEISGLIRGFATIRKFASECNSIVALNRGGRRWSRKLVLR